MGLPWHSASKESARNAGDPGSISGSGRSAEGIGSCVSCNGRQILYHQCDINKYTYKRMGKTRDLFEKIRDTKGTFHAKMGSIKDRNGMDLTEAKDIKKRWQEYPEELYKKDLHDPDNHDGAITHLQSDILECEVKWVLGSIATKLVEVMEFQLSYFKS